MLYELYAWFASIHTLLPFMYILSWLTALFILILIINNYISLESLPIFRFVTLHAHPILLAHLLLLTASVAFFIIPSPTIISPELPLFTPIHPSYQQPLTITFDRPINKDKLKATISPSVKGDWQFSSSNFLGLLTDTISFYPSSSLPYETQFTINLDSIQAPYHSKASSALFIFETTTLPVLERTSPADQQLAFRVDQPISLYFSNPPLSDPRVSYTLTTNPHTEMSYTEVGHELRASPAIALNYNTTYQLSLTREIRTLNTASQVTAISSETIHTSIFTTQSLAAIKSISPSKGKVSLEQPITISFASDMDQDSVTSQVSLTPNTSLQSTWIDSSTLVLAPSNLWQPDTSYQIIIPKTVSTNLLAPLESEVAYSFTTIGGLHFANTNPLPNSANVSRDQTIQLTFDQPISHETIQNLISIQPSTPVNLTWNTAQELQISPIETWLPATEYEISWPESVLGIAQLPRTGPLSLKFTTAPQEVRLQIPVYRQQDAFTCYAAAASMALSYYDISISEADLIRDIGIDSTPRNFSLNTWGDPNQGIVGSLDGSGNGGYGVHWNPVAQAMARYREVDVKTNWNLQELLETVQSGQPVLVWWVNGVWPARDVSWNLPTGDVAYTVNGMHVEVVVGFSGTPSNPIRIYTNDPWRGARSYTPDTFYALWRWFSETALVVK